MEAAVAEVAADMNQQANTGHVDLVHPMGSDNLCTGRCSAGRSDCMPSLRAVSYAPSFNSTTSDSAVENSCTQPRIED